MYHNIIMINNIFAKIYKKKYQTINWGSGRHQIFKVLKL